MHLPEARRAEALPDRGSAKVALVFFSQLFMVYLHQVCIPIRKIECGQTVKFNVSKLLKMLQTVTNCYYIHTYTFLK
jgi:hypothetical protein